MQYDVFISYSREDSIVVDEIYQAIQSIGLNCFVDRVNIPVGANYVDYLRFAIKQCKVFLYIASRNSHNSKWGYYELSEFLKEKDTVKVKVINVDDNGKIGLSIRQAKEKPKQPSISFEDKLSRFMKDSDEKLASLNKNINSKRKSGNRY